MTVFTPAVVVTGFWIKCRSLVRTLLVCSAIIGISLPTNAAGASRMPFDVPADSAEKSLKVFSQQAGLEVLFPTEITRGVRTQPVKGTMSARRALDTMLSGTGLVVFEDKTGAISLQRGNDSPNAQRAAQATASARPRQSREAASVSEEKTVELSPFTVNASQDIGYLAGNTLAGSRMNTPLRDTAASLSILTEELIKDLGATNLTEVLEYANNIQLEVEDAGAFGDNTSGGNLLFSQGTDNFRIRGQRATQARNYFGWDLPIDTFNIERVEQSRGPNSILFGIGSAGGIISSSTKQAITGRSFRRASLSGDDYGSYRGTIDVNQAVPNGKLGIRLNAVYSDRESNRLFAFNEQKRIHLAAKYELSRKTRIRAEYETGLVLEARPFRALLHDGPTAWDAAGRPTFDTPVANTALRVAVRPATTRRVTYISDGNRSADYIMDMAGTGILTNSSFMILDDRIVDPSVNVAGPGALARTSFDTPSLFFEHQLGEKTFLEIGYNHQQSRFRGNQPQGDAAFLQGDPNNRLRTGAANPFAKRYYIEAQTLTWTKDYRSDNYRAMLSTELDYGKWGNYRLAGLGEYEVRAQKTGPLTEVWAGAPFSTVPGKTPEAAANQVFRRGYVTERAWPTYHAPLPGETGLIKNMVDPVTGRTLSSTWVRLNNSVADDPSNQKTWLVGGQARYFNGRLVAGFGYRNDEVDALKRSSKREPVTDEWVTDYDAGTTTVTNGSTRTVGLVAHVTKQISLMYNQSSNLALPPSTQRHTVTGEPLVSAKGTGRDMGFSLSLLEGKIYVRATYFESTAKGTNSIRFGGTNSNPASVANFILTTLRNAGAITQADVDAHTPATGTSSYLDNVADGYEFQVTANPTKNWRLTANYSISDFSESNIAADVMEWFDREKSYWNSFNLGSLVTPNGGNTIDRVIDLMEDTVDIQKSVANRGAVGNRRHKVNVFTRYSFSEGRLKGFSVGGGYKHQSKMLIGKNSLDELQYGNSYWLVDMMLGYRFPRSGLLKNWNVQLNVSNVLDEDRPKVSRLTPEVPIPRIKYQTLQDPRMWRLTSNFEF